MKKLSNELSETIGELVRRHHFKVRLDTFDPERFGNATLEMTAPGITIQFQRDRGQTVVNIKGTGDWFALETILQWLGVEATLDFSAQLAGKVVLENIDAIEKSIREGGESLKAIEMQKRQDAIKRFRD